MIYWLYKIFIGLPFCKHHFVIKEKINKTVTETMLGKVKNENQYTIYVLQCKNCGIIKERKIGK